MNERFPFRFDMVHHNHGETLTVSEFNDWFNSARNFAIIYLSRSKSAKVGASLRTQFADKNSVPS